MKKVINILLSVTVLVSTFMINPINTNAKTLNEARQEVERQLKALEENQNKQQMTDAEIKAANANISLIDAEIKKGEQDIINLENEIQQLTIDIENKKKEIKKIINFFQLSNGESAYLEYTFGATDFTDFIYRTAVTEQLTKYNKKLVTQFNQMIKDNKMKKEEIQTKETENRQRQALIQTELDKLRIQFVNLSSDQGNIKDGLKLMRGTIEDLEKLGCGENEDVTACYNRHNQLPNDTAFWRPTAHGIISSYFGPRSYWYNGQMVYDFHYGLDISIPIGTPVYPVAGGKVVAVDYYPGTGNILYMHHNVNGVQYTSAYEHLNGFNVPVGTIVDKNTVIAYSGNTGQSTGPHLHLSVIYGTHGVPGYPFWGPLYYSNSINPLTKINFPVGSYWQDRTTWYK
ncbi:MAG: peptidoglycan DD-metalloendopeptidase family protein [Bacilli bacterium]